MNEILMTRDDAYELLEGDLRRHLLFLVKTQKKDPCPDRQGSISSIAALDRPYKNSTKSL